MKKQITLYAKDTNRKLIYDVQVVIENNSTTYGYLYLSLKCGYDYINPDYTNQQGYVSATNFIEDVQSETLVYYYQDESIKQCLIDNGYEIIEKLPKIHEIVFE